MAAMRIPDLQALYLKFLFLAPRTFYWQNFPHNYPHFRTSHQFIAKESVSIMRVNTVENFKKLLCTGSPMSGYHWNGYWYGLTESDVVQLLP